MSPVVPSRPTVRGPFADWPVQAYDPAFGFAWYTSPATFVSHASIARGTAEAAECVQRWIDLVLRERKDEIRAAGGLFVFHDWSGVGGYTSEARTHYLARMRARPANYLRHSVTCIRPTPLFRMAVEAGNLVAALTAKAKVELATDPQASLVAHRIQAPRAGARFPGL